MIERLLGIAVGSAIVAGCGRAPRSAPGVTITMPTEGDTLRGTAVHVMLEAQGVELAPATDERAGTAHHHLFLDVDVSPMDQKIPAGVTGIIHLGRAQPEFHWDSVPPGPHRIIAVLGDWQHVPLAGAATDTVRFVLMR